MNVHETLLTRRTIHDFRSEPIPEEALERALQAAIRAPNHKLTNPWRFLRAGPRTREAIVKLGVELKGRKKDLSPEASEKIRAKLAAPPELIIVSQVLDPDPAREREDYAAVACAIENLMLSLWSEGIGSKWSTGGVTTDLRTYALSSIDARKEVIVGFVWIGYADCIPDPPRRALSEVYRHSP